MCALAAWAVSERLRLSWRLIEGEAFGENLGAELETQRGADAGLHADFRLCLNFHALCLSAFHLSVSSFSPTAHPTLHWNFSSRECAFSLFILLVSFFFFPQSISMEVSDLIFKKLFKKFSLLDFREIFFCYVQN